MYRRTLRLCKGHGPKDGGYLYAKESSAVHQHDRGSCSIVRGLRVVSTGSGPEQGSLSHVKRVVAGSSPAGGTVASLAQLVEHLKRGSAYHDQSCVNSSPSSDSSHWWGFRYGPDETGSRSERKIPASTYMTVPSSYFEPRAGVIGLSCCQSAWCKAHAGSSQGSGGGGVASIPPDCTTRLWRT